MGFLNQHVLDKVRRSQTQANSDGSGTLEAELNDAESDGESDVDPAALDDLDTYKDPYDVALSRLEEIHRERKEQRARSALGGSTTINQSYQLPLPRVIIDGVEIHKLRQDIHSEPANKGWDAPESWVVSAQSTAKNENDRKNKVKKESMVSRWSDNI